MNKRHLAVAAALLAVGTVAAYSSGSFQTLPIVAEQSFCASNVSGVSSPSNAPYLQVPGSTQGTGSGICGQTVPAGPPALTGNEIFPADVSTATTSPTFQGQPTTVAVPIILTDSGAYTYSTPNTTLANFSLTNPSNWLILDGPTTLTAINVTLPGTITTPALNGQQFHITSAPSITTLTVNGASGTTLNNGTLLKLGGNTQGTSQVSVSWIYDAPISTWFRVQ